MRFPIDIKYKFNLKMCLYAYGVIFPSNRKSDSFFYIYSISLKQLPLNWIIKCDAKRLNGINVDKIKIYMQRQNLERKILK